MPLESLIHALAAFSTLKTPGRITSALAAGGRSALSKIYEEMDNHSRSVIMNEATALADAEIRVTIFGDPDYPAALIHNQKPIAPILFFKGRRDLFDQPSIGMCGSRNVSDLGLKAARSCGVEVALNGMAVVSGYAKGVDTATHLAALEANGSTVIVLAEGFDHFRVKRDFSRHLDWARTLVVSQFPPSQPWKAFGAMARNGIIYGLSRGLVVIEAGERGGTLAAGQGAMKMGRPVMVLDFADATPPGNAILLAAGAMAVDSVKQLHEVLPTLPEIAAKPVVEKLF